jgi:hypothetical protein
MLSIQPAVLKRTAFGAAGCPPFWLSLPVWNLLTITGPALPTSTRDTFEDSWIQAFENSGKKYYCPGKLQVLSIILHGVTDVRMV